MCVILCDCARDCSWNIGHGLSMVFVLVCWLTAYFGVRWGSAYQTIHVFGSVIPRRRAEPQPTFEACKEGRI